MRPYPPYHGPPRPPYHPPKKKKKKRPKPIWWRKWKLVCVQILLTLIGFQTLRTIILPTGFDVVLLLLLITLLLICYFN